MATPTRLFSLPVDVVEFLVERFPREVLNLPPVYGADVARTRKGA